MKNYIILTIVAALMITACGKKEGGSTYEEKKIAGVKVIRNSTTPADPDLKIVPELLFTVQAEAEDGTENFQSLQQIAVADDGSFFAADPGTFSIRKFSSDGKFITSFGKQGNGPGEFSMMNTGLCTVNNKIIIPDPMRMGVNIFDNNGNFIENINTMQKGIGMVIMPATFAGSSFIALNTTVAQKDGQISMHNKLSVISDTLAVQASVWEKEQLFDPANTAKMMSMGNEYPSYTSGNGNIFLSESGTEKFEISVFNSTGELLYKISMPYRKIRYTEEEKKEINDAMKAYMDPAAKQFTKNFQFEEEFKKVINSMYFDGGGRLWVEKSFESEGDIGLRKIDILKTGSIRIHLI
jgi:hypothetical protein